MKSIFTFFLLFISTFLFAQDDKSTVARQEIKEYYPYVRLDSALIVSKIPPLWVVDGVPVDSTTLRSIEPCDILSIDILKELSSLGYCNFRRAVIILTTTQSRLREFIVKDEVSSAQVPNSYVTFIPDENPADSIMLTADENGKVSTHLLQPGKSYRVKISSVGYLKWEGNYLNNKKETIKFDISRNIVTNTSVIVVGYSSICHRFVCSCGGIRITSTTDDSLSNRTDKLKIFPNPVSRGSAITMEWYAKSDGRLKSQILSLDGKVLSAQNLTTYKGQNRLSFPTESRWSAGIYFIRIIDENGKPVRQEKILVQ